MSELSQREPLFPDPDQTIQDFTESVKVLPQNYSITDLPELEDHSYMKILTEIEPVKTHKDYGTAINLGQNKAGRLLNKLEEEKNLIKSKGKTRGKKYFLKSKAHPYLKISGTAGTRLGLKIVNEILSENTTEEEIKEFIQTRNTLRKEYEQLPESKKMVMACVMEDLDQTKTADVSDLAEGTVRNYRSELKKTGLLVIEKGEYMLNQNLLIKEELENLYQTATEKQYTHPPTAASKIDEKYAEILENKRYAENTNPDNKSDRFKELDQIRKSISEDSNFWTLNQTNA